MKPEQLSILRHALGIGEKGNKRSYRNHFCTGPGSKDYEDCQALVAAGYMTRHEGGELSGGNDIFVVTADGKIAAAIAA